MVVAAPLTSGVLGFVKCRGRRWKAEAKNTLETVAALFAQARISAEERLRHLADHDDLTGLRNRRAPLAYLADRLVWRRSTIRSGKAPATGSSADSPNA